MTLDKRLENVAVIGAAGKMGSGIVLLLAQEMAKLKIKNPEISYHLYAMDVSENALDGLVSYIQVQATKAAEKGCVGLRELYRERSDLIENTDIIHQFVQDVQSVLRPTNEISTLKNAHMVFEAIVEEVSVKDKVLSKVKEICNEDTYYFTNTSSIPINVLDETIGLDGNIIGFHFYNPPAVQKLAELIPAKSTKKELLELSQEIGKRLRKKIFLSNDIAGFIGNGHFMRDILHAENEIKNISDQFSQTEAIYTLNKISQDFLIRPMGIFQLIDYVGVEVCKLIMKVMTKYTDHLTLSSDLLNQMVEKKVLGGQNADGSQKDGFLKYEKNRPVGVYDLSKGDYVAFDDSWTRKVDDQLGTLPDGWAPWRALLMDPSKEEKMNAIFSNLKEMDTFGAKLAKAYFIKSNEIGQGLVDDGVAHNKDDVNAVLMNGFYHLYGPVNDYIG